MIPLEVLTMGGGAALGGGMKIAHMVLKAVADSHKMAIASAKQNEEGVKSARKFLPDGGKWTRRLIVIACISAAVLVPTVGPLFVKNLQINYLYSEATGWICSYDKLKTLTTTGITIMPYHTHGVMAIIGFYFGSRIGK